MRRTALMIARYLLVVVPVFAQFASVRGKSSPGAVSHLPSIIDETAGDTPLDLEKLRTSGYEGRIDLTQNSVIIDPITGKPSLSPVAHPDDVFWEDGYGQIGSTNDGDRVYAAVIWNGDLFIGGRFSAINHQPIRTMARWDGTRWWQVDDTSRFPQGYPVYAMTVFNGELVAGGIAFLAGIPGGLYIASWNGSNWSSLGTGVNSMVQALQVIGGKLYAGGSFDFAGSALTHSIACWDGTTWSGLGNGISNMGNYVNALGVYNGDLIVTGWITLAGDSTVSGIARWNGTAWCRLGAGLRRGAYNGIGYDVRQFGTDLYVAGQFDTAGSLPIKGIARWNGAVWSAVGSGSLGWTISTTDARVTRLYEYGGKLIASGNFDNIGGTAAWQVAQWNGSSWSAMNGGFPMTTAHGGPSDCFVLYGGELIAGGSADWRVDTIEVSLLTRWNGSKWLAWGNGINDFVNALGTYNGDLIVGGYFEQAGTVHTTAIARWSGTKWDSLGPGLENSVWCLTNWNNKLVAGGPFTNTNSFSVTMNYIGVWDGTAWSALGTGMDNYVRDVCVYNNELYACGQFTSAGGTLGTERIARWDGAAWQSVGGGGLDSTAETMGVYGGKLIVVGRFTVAGGVPCSKIAAWDGSNWSALGAGLDRRTTALMEHQGKLIVGGYFRNAGGAPADFIAQWDGLNWSTLGLGVDSAVWGLQSVGDTLYVGGWFSYAGGALASRVAKWDGALWHAMGSGINSSPSTSMVYEILSWNNRIMVGGFDMSTAGGKAACGLAAWTTDGDGDGIVANVDNCPYTYNPDQADVDGDGVGNVCDNCPTVANPNQADANHNGIGDACEVTSCCVGTTGNVNMAGIVDLADLSALVSYLTGGGYVLLCKEEANVNYAGIVDLADLSALVSYLTGGGYVLPNCL